MKREKVTDLQAAETRHASLSSLNRVTLLSLSLLFFVRNYAFESNALPVDFAVRQRSK